MLTQITQITQIIFISQLNNEQAASVGNAVSSSSSERKHLQQQQPQSAAFLSREGMAERRRVPYINLPTSSYGKIVMKKYVELQESAGPVVNCQPIKIPVSACCSSVS